MLTDKQIDDQQRGIMVSPETPLGHLRFDFIYESHIGSPHVIFRIYRADGEKLFGTKMPMGEWDKLKSMIERVSCMVNNEQEES